MEILNYILKFIVENALILIPALMIIGLIIKRSELIPNKYIPALLLPIGIVSAMALCGWTVEGAIQGVLVTGVTVYIHQLVKQSKKGE